VSMRADEAHLAPSAAAFCDAEIERLSACLVRLLPNLRREDVAITGGVAIQAGLAELGRAGTREAIADLDLVIRSLDAVSSSVADEFLVSHYHVVQPGVAKLMVQLVDPVTRIRVDMFPDLVGSLSRSRVVKIGTHATRMLALEDILEHKLLTLSKASAANPVDPKHAEDAYALGALFQWTIPAVARGSLVKDVYGTNEYVPCRRCELSGSARFPLAPKQLICSLLGWRLQGDANSAVPIT
jgi:hypothetical protein